MVPYLDLIHDMDDGLRFRTNAFPTDKYALNVYYDIGEDACEKELAYPPGAQVYRN